MSAIEILDREQYPVEVCDQRIREAQKVLDSPDDFSRREYFDARRALVKWTRRREASVAWTQVKHAAEYLFDFASRMPGFWQHDMTGPARQIFARTMHLVEDAEPFTQCNKCGRKSWSITYGRCGMVQPDGSRCDGRMV